MKPADQIVFARAHDDALDVLNLLAQRDINQALVVEGGRVAGLVRRAAILRWLALHASPRSRPAEMSSTCQPRSKPDSR